MSREGAPTLSTTCDALVVPDDAVRAWSRIEDCSVGEARRTLTAIAALSRAVDAGPAAHAGVGAEHWRYRRGRQGRRGMDVSLRVTREERLGAHIAVVSAMSWARRR